MNEKEKTLLTPEEQERRHQVAEQQRRKARAERARKKRRAKKIKLTIGIVFVTLLTAAAVFIITRYVLPDAGKDAQQPKTSPSEEQTSSETTQTPTTAPEPTHDYPELKSKNGTFSTYSSGAIRVDNAAFSVCGTLSDSVTSKYAALVSEVADSLNGKTKVYSLIIPTSYGVTLPDDIKTQIANYADQGENIAKVFSKMSENVTPVYCYDDLMTHRDEYLYFRTDHHWNGKGAYYAYAAFCRTKGIEPYTLEEREKKEFDGFLGTMYQNNGKDENLLPADTVEAFLPVSANAAMKFTNTEGTTYDWPIVKDGEKLTVSVATKRSEQYGKDPDQQWFWIWSETYSGIDFEVDQILSTAVDERKSLMFASGDLPDLLFGINLDTSELVRYGMGEGMLLDLTPYITPEIMPNL